MWLPKTQIFEILSLKKLFICLLIPAYQNSQRHPTKCVTLQDILHNLSSLSLSHSARNYQFIICQRILLFLLYFRFCRSEDLEIWQYKKSIKWTYILKTKKFAESAFQSQKNLRKKCVNLDIKISRQKCVNQWKV